MPAQPSLPVSIIVLGASGDLARRKIFPALFALYCQDHLPPETRIFGYSRTEYTDDAFRDHIREKLTCRYAPGDSCAELMREFLERCHYVTGQYDDPDAYLDLYARMRQVEETDRVNRIFYLAIPPSVFTDVSYALGKSGLVQCTQDEPWTRVVIEKPFGHDRPSSDELTRKMSHVFTEEQTYRIDHYLGKEVIQNLMVLRFANTVFDPLWNSRYVESVQINWKEDVGVEGRSYFDRYGIVRDVMQNHLLQIAALVAMEKPDGTDAKAVRDAKETLLRCIPPLKAGELVLGQYTAGSKNGKPVPAYTEDETVADDSLTPTYGSAVLRVDNERWRGTRFHMRAGKALDGKLNEVRIRFRDVDADIYAWARRPDWRNELVIRIQPDEALYLTIANKEPGLRMSLTQTDLNLRYEAAFDKPIPEAYESLLLDIIEGDKSLFIRADELAAAWDIFTPALHELEQKRVKPLPYAFGSKGPENPGGHDSRTQGG